MLKKSEKKAIIRKAYYLALSGDKDMLKLFIQNIAKEKELKADTTKDILTLIEKGMVSVNEASSLMKMLKDKAEIEEIPKLIDKLKRLESKKR